MQTDYQGGWMQSPVTLLHLVIAVLGLAVVISVPVITSMLNGSERITRVEQDQTYAKKINDSQDSQLAVLSSAFSGMQITMAQLQIRLDVISRQLEFTNKLLDSRSIK